MEDSVALDSSKQKQFVKSIKGIQKLIKKNHVKDVNEHIVSSKTGKVTKPRHKQRGLVYLSHIPHGFYEHEMTQYFKQFGVVTNARVIRSKRTGNSKGHAFVEFKEPAVAQIVAETMNNYLMGKRLIKAAYVPPEKQRRHAMRKHWNAQNNPGNDLRIKLKKAFNETKDEEGELKRADKLLNNFIKTKKKLEGLGLNYDFFTPVDVPDSLLHKLVKKEKETDADEIHTEKIKKNKTGDGTDDAIKIEKLEHEKITKVKSKEFVKVNAEKNKNVVKTENNFTKKSKHLKKNSKPETLKIVKNQPASGEESDSTYNFDSDEFEKTIENEDEFGTDIDSIKSEDDDDDITNISEEYSLFATSAKRRSKLVVKKPTVEPKKHRGKLTREKKNVSHNATMKTKKAKSIKHKFPKT